VGTIDRGICRKMGIARIIYIMNWFTIGLLIRRIFLGDDDDKVTMTSEGYVQDPDRQIDKD
jgi:hypothetical protein